MDRLEQLQNKIKESKGGFLSLTKEEKDEYRELKGSDKKDTITLDRSELEKLIDSRVEQEVKKRTSPGIKDDKLFDKWEEWKEIEGNNQTATLKKYKTDKGIGLIIKQEFDRVQPHPRDPRADQTIYKISIRYDGGEIEDLEMDANELASINAVEKVELVENDRKQMIKKCAETNMIVTPKKDGYIVRRADSSYGRAEGGYEVQALQTMYKETFTVKRENGETFKIEGIYLNS